MKEDDKKMDKAVIAKAMRRGAMFKKHAGAYQLSNKPNMAVAGQVLPEKK